MSDEPKRAVHRLPVTWSQGAMEGGGQKIKDSALVIAPDDAQVGIFGDQRARTCGSCRHFRGPEKDRPAVSAFIARAVLEAKWKLGYLASDPSQLGRCNEDNELCTGPTSRACDHYTEARGRLK